MTTDRLAERVLRNGRGDRVTILNHGARLTRIELKLSDGMRNVILGYEDRADYLTDPYFMGATVGRTCNRIAGARFNLGGVDYPLDANERGTHLHGGAGGFHNRPWSIDAEVPDDTARFRLRSVDGDQGYPGTVEATATYRWTDERELLIRLEADDLLPTGDFLDVTGSGLDLRQSAALRDVVGSRHPLVVRAGGMDFNYVLDESGVCAELESPNGDLCLRMTTTCPGLQVYSGQKLGQPFAPHRGLCLEPQHFPDTPNQPAFPGTLLAPGERYSQTTRYRFMAAG
jgi:aldose 1-epimerase